MKAFDVLNSIFDKKEIDYKQSDLPPYIISLWLSGDKHLIDIVNRMNCVQFQIKPEMVYKYYFYKIPKGRRFIKWVKKKEVFTEDQKKLVDDIQKANNISKIEMSKYLSMLEKIITNNDKKE